MAQRRYDKQHIDPDDEPERKTIYEIIVTLAVIVGVIISSCAIVYEFTKLQ